jgi:hypothetical protein
MNTRATARHTWQHNIALRDGERKGQARRILKVREHPRNQTRNTLVHGRVRVAITPVRNFKLNKEELPSWEPGRIEEEYDKRCLVLLFPGVCLPNVGIHAFLIAVDLQGADDSATRAVQILWLSTCHSSILDRA